MIAFGPLLLCYFRFFQIKDTVADRISSSSTHGPFWRLDLDYSLVKFTGVSRLFEGQAQNSTEFKFILYMTEISVTSTKCLWKFIKLYRNSETKKFRKHSYIFVQIEKFFIETNRISAKTIKILVKFTKKIMEITDIAANYTKFS